MARRRNGSGVPAEPQAARDHFLNAAEACFDRYGIAKTTMDDIAQMAGVSRPTVYRHFDDRESLIVAVIFRRAKALVAKAQKQILKQKTFEDRLVEGLALLVSVGRKDPFVQMLVNPDQMGLANQMFGASSTAVDLTLEMWEPIFEEARANGELRDDLEFREMAKWLTYVELVLVGRVDVAADVRSEREMIRKFVRPAFADSAKPAGVAAGR
jgi:AcrR family transcriptional regulator